MKTGADPRWFVLFTSDEPYGAMGNSHQHYFDVLSQRYETLFVQPPGKWKFRNLFRKKGLLVQSGNAALFQYVNYFPVSRFRVFFTKINDRINSWYLSKLVKGRQHVLCWKFDSFRMMKVHFIPVEKTIYHVVDPVFRKETDPYVSRSADLFVLVNKAYFSHYGVYGKKMIYIPHGIRSEDFVLEPGRAEALQRQYGDYFLVTGSINSDVNLPLLHRIAEGYPDHTLLIVGINSLSDPEQVESFEALLRRPNVTFTGPVHYLELKYYVKGARLCLVAYQSLRPGFYRNPIKITNYISQARPVVNSVKIPELADLEGKILFSTTDDDAFIGLVRQVLDGVLRVDEPFVKAYLEDHRYEKLVATILENL